MARIVKALGFETGGPSFVWRAMQNLEQLKKQGRETAELFDLPPVYDDIASFYALATNRDVPQEIVNDAFPDHYMAWKWFLSTYPSSPRWYLEALLLTDLSLAEIANKVGYSISPLVVDIYKRAFFNITAEHKNNLGWMRQYIWVPGMTHQSSLFYYDFIYKLAAVYSGIKTIDMLITPEELSTESKKWIRQIISDYRDRYMLTSGNMYANLNIDNQVVVQEAISKEWAELTKASETSSTLTDDAMRLLVDAVGKSAVLLNKSDQLAPIETFQSLKYADDEIKKA